ncbi:unnamed protein product [Trifolium pratense]|uniref:Uncharacterized protein n=1 Tax=Trifolium pratense TaxID=57577 RepID=A0ACB0JKB4_TRIPR|nr:unnamed protein product [Trifolium pratense]
MLSSLIQTFHLHTLFFKPFSFNQSINLSNYFLLLNQFISQPNDIDVAAITAKRRRLQRSNGDAAITTKRRCRNNARTMLAMN